MADSHRLFLGMPVALSAVRALEEHRGALRAALGDARWVPPEAYHVTLCFLGWTRTEAIAALEDSVSVALADQASFSWSVSGLGAFPDAETARVLWAGAGAGRQELIELSKRLVDAVRPLGFENARVADVPHVTVARFREPRDVSTHCVETTLGDCMADEVVLYESRTESSAVRYEERRVWPLRVVSG